MTSSAYEKASKIVTVLQRQLDAANNPAEILKKISEFLESQNDKVLKEIATVMKRQATDQSKKNKV